MKTHFILPVISLLLLLSFPVGCTNREQKETDSLKEKVMTVHDEAMTNCSSGHLEQQGYPTIH